MSKFRRISIWVLKYKSRKIYLIIKISTFVFLIGFVGEYCIYSFFHIIF